MIHNQEKNYYIKYWLLLLLPEFTQMNISMKSQPDRVSLLNDQPQ